MSPYGRPPQLTGTLTLDLQGNPNAFFLFKIGSTLTTRLNGRALARNGALTLDTNTVDSSACTSAIPALGIGGLLALLVFLAGAGLIVINKMSA